VRYCATPSGPKVREAMRAGLLDMIATPAQGNRLEPVPWAADNGCFGDGYPGDDAWFAWLRAHADLAGRCRFAVAPDVFDADRGRGDAAATLARSAPWLPRLRELGYPAALVAQDGLEELVAPWDAFDALFIGGSTGWKLGPHAAALTAEAKRRGKWVHMGRVNSYARLRHARDIGCDSADGTFLAFGPDRNLPRLLAWLAALDAQPSLWEAS
jgi:hypothetical protein